MSHYTGGGGGKDLKACVMECGDKVLGEMPTDFLAPTDFLGSRIKIKLTSWESNIP